MKSKFSVFFFLFFVINVFSQNTFFIKYKNSVEQDEIENKIKSKSIFLLSEKMISPENYSVSHFAKSIGVGKGNLGKIIKVQFDASIETEGIESILKLDPDIEYVQKSLLYKINNVPNDSLFSRQWALQKIDALSAWKITKGNSSVVVGVIDTGVDYLHPDLANKIFINSGETGSDSNGNDKKFNGIDDDGNGFIDDYMGWDFTDRIGFPYDSTGGDYLTWDNDPMDQNLYSHGTAVSGIIGAQTNNSIGIAGVAPNIRVLNLRAFDPDGYGEEDDVASAIIYAVSMGAKVINMSFGDYSFSYVLRDVIRYAYSQNVVLVASSGNSNSSAPHYPSGYSEVISVGNSTKEDYVSSNSNYGSTLDLVAPGSSIMTTLRKSTYGDFSGTSAAAPFVSASAAMVLSMSSFTNEEVKQIIKSSTDDINGQGWDLRSGAGRLNLAKALQSLSASRVQFDFPKQDFATKSDSMPIVISVLSPFFIKYELLWGIGENPKSWNTININGLNQTANDTIHILNLKPMADSTYTLRLILTQSNGRTLEERVNFHIIRTLPQGELVSLFPALYGERPTIMSAFFTPKPVIVRMLFREVGEINFKSVSLDGLATNNQFVKRLHYGFIPAHISKPSTDYEIYFELENLVGLKTNYFNGSSYFKVKTAPFISQTSKTKMDFSLQAGLLHENPVSILSNNNKEVLLRDLTNSTLTKILTFNNGEFTLVDSISERIPKGFGDFNNNGHKDLLANWGRNTFIMEQNSANQPKFTTKHSIENSNSWPILVRDIDKDGINELLTVVSDSLIYVYKIRSDLKLDSVAVLRNFTPKGFGSNSFDFPSCLVVDSDNDGNNEIWLVDTDGDIFSYKVLSNNRFIPETSKIIRTEFSSSSNYITSGDFDGDGKLDIAVILHSISELDIASYHRVIVFNVSTPELKILYDNAFVDPASEFNRFTKKTYNSIRFVNVNNDNTDELAVFLFPYAYLIQHKTTAPEIISFDENINASVVFVSDFNGNGTPEIAFPRDNGIMFYEFSPGLKPNTPTLVKGFSDDSVKIKLQWSGEGAKYYIYKSIDGISFAKFDSTLNKSFFDGQIELGKYYYYRIQSFDPTKNIAYSDFSLPVSVFHHKPGRVVKVESRNDKSLYIRFSEKINTTIENPKAFELFKDGRSIYPNSFSPADQYSYVVTFTENFVDGQNSIQINELNDFYGSPIVRELVFFYYIPKIIQHEFFVQSFEILSPTKIKVIFNIEVDSLSITNKSNYLFEPYNSVKEISIDNFNKKMIYISVNNVVGSIGKEYRLSLQNIYSSVASGKLEINKGAGGVIILTKFASDLSEIYFYPSPAKINNGTGTLTFSNLPNFAEITIWNLSGQKIITLKEKDGNGGLTWDLRDDNGTAINSGVYIYRIARLQSNNEEIETKIGKIAVVK